MLPRIAILLPTFNGAKYLAEQLDSLTAQTYENLVLVLRDDGSEDDTLEIVRSHRAISPQKIHVIEDSGSHLGACQSFAYLMQYVLEHKRELGLNKAYMMFCDQDDIWARDKAQRQMQYMKAAEDDSGTIPVLVHSDLEVISDSGGPLADSFMEYQGLVPERNAFGQILFCNPVTGCTVLINEALAVRALPVPARAVMHDWWLALVAAAFGKLIFVDAPLVQYRQHRANTLGAVKRPSLRTIGELAGKIRRTEPDPSLHQAALQADAFLERFGSKLNNRRKIRLRLVSVLRTRSGILQKIFRRLGRRF